MNSKPDFTTDRSGNFYDSPVSISSDGGDIPSSDVFKGLLQCKPEVEITVKLPDANALIKECPHQLRQGSCKRFSIRNDGSAAITLTVGEGGSINGSSTIPVSSYAAHFVLRFINIHGSHPNYQLIRE